jgi:hypothetical protein
MKSSV